MSAQGGVVEPTFVDVELPCPHCKLPVTLRANKYQAKRLDQLALYEVKDKELRKIPILIRCPRCPAARLDMGPK